VALRVECTHKSIGDEGDTTLGEGGDQRFGCPRRWRDWDAERYDKADLAGVAYTADYDVYSSGIGLAAASQSVYARLIAKNVTGTISLEVVMGTPAAAGSEAIPSNAAVQTQVGATVPWCDIALCHLARNSGTTLTQTEWNGYRLKTRKGTQD